MVEFKEESTEPLIELATNDFRNNLRSIGVLPISVLEFLDTEEVRFLYEWLGELSPRGHWVLGQRLTIERHGRRIIAVVCHTNGCWAKAPIIMRDLVQDLRSEGHLKPTEVLGILIPRKVQERPVFEKICDGLEAIAQHTIISGH